MITMKSVLEFKEYLESGRWEEDFGYRTPDGQAEMLDLLENIFVICEKADEILTKRLYKQLEENTGQGLALNDSKSLNE